MKTSAGDQLQHVIWGLCIKGDIAMKALPGRFSTNLGLHSRYVLHAQDVIAFTSLMCAWPALSVYRGLG